MADSLPTAYEVIPSDAGNEGELIGLLGLTYGASTAQKPFNSLYVGVTGDISILAKDGTQVDLGQVPVGLLQVSGKRVMATGTAATEITAFCQ